MWKLRDRNAYIVLANNVKVIDGKWDQDKEGYKGTNALQGGWNILGDVQRRQPTPIETSEGTLFSLSKVRSDRPGIAKT